MKSRTCLQAKKGSSMAPQEPLWVVHNKIPAKRFSYLPLGPRLKRMFGTLMLSEIIQEDRHEMFDIQDSPDWASMYSQSGVFNGDKRGLSIALCADGLNPFAQLCILCGHLCFLC